MPYGLGTGTGNRDTLRMRNKPALPPVEENRDGM